MSTAAMEIAQPDATAIEAALVGGDLSKLTAAQRVIYYKRVCESLGLNPLTKPLDYITLNNKLTLYARKDCTDQLRKLQGISIDKPDIQFQDEWIIVSVMARNQAGRTDADTGVVNRTDMRGDFGNALMKAVTKAKRRVTLSICGLGMLDETEVETIPQASVPTQAPARIAVPEGAVQILEVQASEWGGDVVVVDHAGVETTHKASGAQLTALCEQIAQEGVPVRLEFATITRGKNAGRQKLSAVHRWTETPALPPIEATTVEPVDGSDIAF